jgi:2,3-dihydroxybenzoate-AMP ligase
MCACVLLRKNASLSFDQLKNFLLEKEIAKYKIPERLEILPDFPLSTFGKVSKKKLAEIVATRTAVERKTATSLSG